MTAPPCGRRRTVRTLHIQLPPPVEPATVGRDGARALHLEREVPSSIFTSCIALSRGCAMSSLFEADDRRLGGDALLRIAGRSASNRACATVTGRRAATECGVASECQRAPDGPLCSHQPRQPASSGAAAPPSNAADGPPTLMHAAELRDLPQHLCSLSAQFILISNELTFTDPPRLVVA